MQFRRVNFSIERFSRMRGKHPSIRIMKVYRSGFDGNLIFIDALITSKSKMHSEVVFTLSPKTSLYLTDFLIKELAKVRREDIE